MFAYDDDGNGNQTLKHDPRSYRTTSAFDALNRLTQAAFADQLAASRKARVWIRVVRVIEFAQAGVRTALVAFLSRHLKILNMAKLGLTPFRARGAR